MKRKYEIVYIFDSALEEPEVNEHLDRFHALLKSSDQAEPVTGMAHWGKRTLAYPIKKKEVGYYVVVHVETETGLLSEFERIVKLNESVLRYLVVINEGLPAARVDQADSEGQSAGTEASGDVPKEDAEAPVAGEAPALATDETTEAEVEKEKQPAPTEGIPEARVEEEQPASTDEGGE